MMLNDALSGRAAPTDTTPPRAMWVISWEIFAYALLALVVIVLRLAELDTVPPRMDEIPNMLAAWRGQPVDSPLLFWAQRIGFGLLGGTVFAGRLLTVLASVAVVFAPVMFRAELGRSRAFVLSLFLATLPPLFIASRTAEAVVWTLLVAAVTLRVGLTAIQTAHRGWWAAAIVCLMGLVMLTEASGVIVALMLVVAGIGALIWDEADAEPSEPLELDDTEPEIAISAWARVREQLRHVPWERGVLFGVLMVMSLSTMLLAWDGLNGIGGVLTGFLNLFGAGNPDHLVGAVLFYLPWTAVLAIGAIWLVTQDGWGLVDRFWAILTALGVLVAVLIPGLTNAHAVLLAVPLCGLASGTVTAAFYTDRRRTLWAEAESAAGDDLAAIYRPSAGRWILGGVVFALLLLISVHFQTLSREVLLVFDGGIDGFFARLQSSNVLPDVRIGLLWSFIGLMFLIIGFFLAAGIWGNRTTLQGYVLGVFVFLTLTQLSAGWYTTVFNADNPVESWGREATGRGYTQLSDTLHDFMMRESSGFTLLPITVVRDPSTGVTEDGLLGWMLKDQRVTFVDSIAEARTRPFVIVPNNLVDTEILPDLGGSYVGQRFILTRTWSPTTVLGADVLPWWLQRQTRSQPYAVQMVTLWVRQDVFEGAPISDLLP